MPGPEPFVVRPLHLALYRSLTDTRAHPAQTTWAELPSALGPSVARVDKQAAPLWAPTLVSPDATAGANAVQALSCLVYDLDDGGDLPATVGESGLAAYAHRTYSGGWRVVLATTRDHTPNEHPALWRAGALALGIMPDPVTCDVGRRFFAPSHPLQGAGSAPLTFSGSFFDVGKTLQGAEFVPAPWQGPTGVDFNFDPPVDPPPPIEKFSEIFDLREIQEAARRLGGMKGKILGELVSRTFVPQKGSRDNTIHQVMCLLATSPRHPPEEALAAHLVDAFVAKMEVAPEGADYWKKKAMHSFARAREGRIKRDELLGAFPAPDPEAKGDWRADMDVILDKDGNAKRLDASGRNLELILRNDPHFATLRYNVMTRTVEATEGPLANVPFNSIDTALHNWIQGHEYRIKMPRAECFAQLLNVARERRHDPVREYLLGLKWDGTKRIANVLMERTSPRNVNKFLLPVMSRKFFISAVARGLQPGCQVDTVLVLTGRGGAGKTSFVRVLGGDFAGNINLDVANKDSLMMLTGRWLVELDELSSAKRSDVEVFRGFITRTVDHFRPPYERAVVAEPRRCVFIGTSNDSTPVHDSEGWRRYWPVEVDQIDLEWLADNRDQLWAEAVVEFQAGAEWWLGQEEAAAHAIEVGLFRKAEALCEPILAWIYEMKVEDRPTEVSGMDVATRCLGMTTDRWDERSAASIGKALTSLGFTKIRTRIDNVSRHYYRTPEHLLKGITFKRRSMGIPMALVNGGKESDGTD